VPHIFLVTPGIRPFVTTVRRQDRNFIPRDFLLYPHREHNVRASYIRNLLIFASRDDHEYSDQYLFSPHLRFLYCRRRPFPLPVKKPPHHGDEVPFSLERGTFHNNFSQNVSLPTLFPLPIRGCLQLQCLVVRSLKLVSKAPLGATTSYQDFFVWGALLSFYQGANVQFAFHPPTSSRF